MHKKKQKSNSPLFSHNHRSRQPDSPTALPKSSSPKKDDGEN